MGARQSSLGSSATSAPSREKRFGICNFGNTCYFNSVFQALYHCHPFRQCVLSHWQQFGQDDHDSLLSMLGDLFDYIDNNPEDEGTLEPKHFFARVGEQNAMFVGDQHQDAHEFLHFLLSEFSDRVNLQLGDAGPENWIELLFEGILTNNMRCLRCDATTSRDEKFLDLSVNITNHSSLYSCLKEFGRPELLSQDCKFRCSECFSLQEAYKWMQVKKQPEILICHLKRFKYSDDLELNKLCYRVCFSEQLRLPNLCKDAESYLYELFAIVVHIGAVSSHGHYVAVVRKNDHWHLYDDHIIRQLPDNCLSNFFGSHGQGDHSDGYILFYQHTQSDKNS